MPERKLKMTKAATVMLQKASDCLDLAKVESESAIAQHANAARMREAADVQSDSAKKLTELGHALEADAANLQGAAELRP
jgi:hypothetical protein